MQTTGRLTKWNEEKGYGFITPQRGGQDIMVDISAFPEDGHPPQLHEQLSFNVEKDDSGKSIAVQIRRINEKQNRPSGPSKVRKRVNPTTFLASLALFIAILAYGYLGLYRDNEQPVPAKNPIAEVHSKCDGRTQCSQMTSCEESQFFLHNCPNVQLDGNGDGIPCEQQWCGK